MKLVSSERIKNYIKTQINPYGKPFEGSAYEFGIKLLNYLSNKDADYDVDKVIKELSEWTVNADIVINRDEVVNRDVIVGCTVIDIVKEGGMQTSMYDNQNTSSATSLEKRIYEHCLGRMRIKTDEEHRAVKQMMEELWQLRTEKQTVIQELEKCISSTGEKDKRLAYHRALDILNKTVKIEE